MIGVALTVSSTIRVAKGVDSNPRGFRLAVFTTSEAGRHTEWSPMVVRP